MRNIKKYIFGCLILLVLILSISLSKTKIYDYYEAINTKDKKYEIKNIGTPNWYYFDILQDKQLVYLFGFEDIDIYDISDSKKITKVKEINGYPILDFGRLKYHYWEIDFDRKSIYMYGLTSDCLFVELYNYNDTHIINLEVYLNNISIGNNLESYHFYNKNESTLYAIAESKIIDKNTLTSWLNISLLTIDTSNKTKPEILDQSSVYFEEGFITWINTQQVNFDWNTFHISNNLLFLVRNYRDYDDDGRLSFKSGFMKIWDIRDNSEPIELATINMDKWSHSYVTVYNDLLYCNIGNYGFDLYNISDPNNFHKLAVYINDCYPKQFIFKDNILYLINGKKIEILDVSNPNKIKKISQYIPRIQGNGHFSKGILQGNVLYLIRSSEFKD